MTAAEPSPPGDSLGDGAAGMALLPFERARTDDPAAVAVAHQWAKRMTTGTVAAHPDLASLFRGAPAVAFALHTSGQPAYARALDSLDEHIVTLTRYRLQAAHDRIDEGRLPAVREFDLISGLTGIGAYLLHRDRHSQLLREVLAYLVRLTEPVQVDGDTLPGWWSAAPPADRPAEDWPGGHGNLGLAHGAAGPLALLATAMRHGTTVPGQEAAMATIGQWFDRCRVGAGRAAWWPGRITLAEQRTGVITQDGPQRPSWCYGTPGQARAQQLAALALGDLQRRQQAEDAFAGCVTDDRQLVLLRDNSLCHGFAGLVLAAWRAAADAAPGNELAVVVPRLRTRLEQRLHIEGSPDSGGLLEGEAGTRLAGHTVDTDQPEATQWDLCLLLSG
ncbi:lanthionine synthetase C family protein [Actinokineospora xionganensis]|uniref:Lanthionine synthetase C family protein n=1 Tax=Actinokineospora xionganensis TaxID=2684470 RepID=A0ABR7LDY1_9PSEU|nr:lanthionine synthetase C family protein [Actinokineospora xionganensis]MBC6450910.1 lanthionine synthetase C family protein [Actinokineospora xionganensis]